MTRLPSRTLQFVLLGALSVASVPAQIRAQAAYAPVPAGSQVIVNSPSGPPVIMKVEGAVPAEAKPAGDQPDGEQAGGKEGDAAKDPKEKPDGEQKKEAEKPPAVIQRPMESPVEANRDELKVRPDEQGRIHFSFHGQKWPDVLQWLAEVSGMSLDWQELPGDYLNLVTQRDYTLEEARDLINRHLLARGFTLLAVGEVLSVVKTENINPGLVPRVEPEQLVECAPHQFVKVSFPLDWLIAESVAEELKPMVSPNGKLTALSGTNRLEAMDAAANLREIYEVLQREQSAGSQERLVQEFVLLYARAADVREQLMSLLGMAEKSAAGAMPMTPQQMQQMQQQQAAMMAQMQQQQQQQQGGRPGGPTAKRKSEDVNLVVNVRRNSILANAPPDKMAVIQKAIEVIDVPPDREQSLLLNVNRMQVYRLASLDPAILVRILQETGDLDPGTRLEVDSKNRAIIAYASLADHLTIRTVIEKLDGSARQFEVVRLRRLDAEYVAGTVAAMMGQEEEKSQDDRSRYYGYFGMRYGQSEEDSNRDKFRVDADVVGNRLLLWANEMELEEVTNLLVKLGEIPGDGQNLDRVRVLDVELGQDAERLLEQIQRVWPSLAPNPLELPQRRGVAPGQNPGRDEATAPQGSGSEARRSPPPPAADVIRFAQLLQSSGNPSGQQETPRPADPPGSDPAPQPTQEAGPGVSPEEADGSDDQPDTSQAGKTAAPPVQISVDSNGRLVISSQDTAALNLLEDLLAQLASPPKDYKLFSLKYASAFWVRLNLQDFFKEEDKDDSRQRRSPFYWDYPPQPERQERPGLSKRRPLKFIDDPDTNTILVVGANAEQLAAIEDLIKMWDVPPSADSESARISAVFQIRYSRAEVIAESIKEVYRDLLSSNDKALQQGKEEKRQPGGPTYIFGGGGDEETDRRTQVAFKGKLSLGIDTVSNTLLVSTEGQNLMDNISQIVEALDKAAEPAAHVQVLTLRGDVSGSRVREVLSEMLGQPINGKAAGNGQSPAPGGPFNNPAPTPGGMTVAPAPR
jgi:type II secretory pathway component GspD/PulD (secretin)